MFCPSNETLQNLTEKTKLLAQKCSHQIRVASGSASVYGASEQSSAADAPLIATSGVPTATAVVAPMATDLPPPPPPPLPKAASTNNHAATKEGSRSLRCLCPCKGTISKMLAKKLGASVGSKEHGTISSTTRWYVKPTWRLWGEEREQDAIYTVYLKKVRYHRPTPSASSVSTQLPST
ncbi:uncharacterized protein LOC134289569 isoform X2 [Aedes albopictus]|uniref:Secreted protein n=1 Tax=Aedes albopictus TaxID=7160 RepID=A0ABM1YJC3_AEDAL